MPKPYTLTEPCANCPFRKDIPFYLSKGRAEEIAESLESGASFHCHKTIDYSDEGEPKITGRARMCAGALGTLEREGNPNQIMRIAERLGIYDRTILDPDMPVYDSLSEWVASMERSGNLQRDDPSSSA